MGPTQGWCVDLTEMQNYSQGRGKLSQGNEGLFCSHFSGLKWFIHLSFKLSCFKQVECTFWHLLCHTDGNNSKRLKQVRCLVLILSETRGEFWEVPAFIHPDLSSLIHCCFLTAWHSCPTPNLVNSTPGLQSLGHCLAESCTLGSIFIFWWLMPLIFGKCFLYTWKCFCWYNV